MSKASVGTIDLSHLSALESRFVARLLAYPSQYFGVSLDRIAVPGNPLAAMFWKEPEQYLGVVVCLDQPIVAATDLAQLCGRLQYWQLEHKLEQALLGLAVDRKLWDTGMRKAYAEHMAEFWNLPLILLRGQL